MLTGWAPGNPELRQSHTQLYISLYNTYNI